MIINKFQGKTESEAVEKAKKEMGPDVVIMSVKTLKPKGVFRAFRGIVYEVTAALEENEADKSSQTAKADAPGAMKQPESISLAADERIQIPFAPPQPSPGQGAPAAGQAVSAQHPAGSMQKEAVRQEGPGLQAVPNTSPVPQGAPAAAGSIGRQSGSYGMQGAGNGQDSSRYQPVADTPARYSMQTAGPQISSASTVPPGPVPSSPMAPSSSIEERLDSLQSLLEDRISAEKQSQEDGLSDGQAQEGFSFVKMLYQTLLDNEVHEKYANQILDELEKISSKGNNIDYILSHIYQKLILKFGQPKPIDFRKSRLKVAFFIGPTGVGKTTTIAKIASRYKVDEGKKVAFLTADTYRIAAAEQLRTYANILDMPLTIVYSSEELKDAVDSFKDCDLILVDTAGFSHKNAAQCEDVKNMLGAITGKYDTEVYLVLSATTKYRDLQEICNTYRAFADYKLVFTKLDETSCYGNLLNIHLYSGASLSYATYGQNVPDDIEVFDTQKIVKKLLGGD